MTDEERRRMMEFILEQQAQFAANIQQHDENFRRMEEERIRERPRWAELRESFQTLVQLTIKYDERLDTLDSSTAALERKTLSFEEASRLLARLVEKNTTRLDKLESHS
jgi:hypothetical protein